MTADALYHEALLEHARAAVEPARLERPDASATRDNPLCGDEVTVDVRLRNGRIAAIGYRVRGCVLCQASVAMIAAAAPGRTSAEIAAARAALAAMLEGGAPAPGPPWDALEAFLPVRTVGSRRDCVLLPFDALGDALARPDGGR